MKQTTLALTEMQIVHVILEYLSCVDVLAWRENSGKYSVGNIFSTRRYITGAPAGTPDIIGVLGKTYRRHFGQMLGIEVKKPGNKTSPAQDRRIEELLDHGAYVFVAFSKDDVEEQLERLKLEKI